MLIRGDWISNSIKRLIQASVRSNKEVVTQNICACYNKKLFDIDNTLFNRILE